MSSEAPKSEQIQANVAAALSRLRGDLSSSSVASAVISVPAPNAAPEPAPADPLQVGMPEMPRHVSDAILQADPAMASPSSERRLREPEVEKTTPYQRIAGLQIEQPDLLSGVANTPPPLPDLSDNEAAGAVYARRRRNRLVLMGSVAAIVVLGALWMFMSGGSDEVVAPPVITADATPEKVKPEDEGGMQVQNLNTTILDQSQTQQGGETVMPPPETPVAPPAPAATADAQPDAMQATDVPSVPAPAAPDAPSVAAPDTAAAPVVTPTPAPAPTPEPAATVAATPTPEPTPAPAPEPAPAAQTTTPEPAALQTAAAPVEVPAGSVRIQFAAVKTEAAAADVWAKLQKKYPAVLGGLGLNVEKVDKAGSVLYRVQAGPFADKAAAKQACVKLKAQKQDCIVAR